LAAAAARRGRVGGGRRDVARRRLLMALVVTRQRRHSASAAHRALNAAHQTADGLCDDKQRQTDDDENCQQSADHCAACLHTTHLNFTLQRRHTHHRFHVSVNY